MEVEGAMVPFHANPNIIFANICLLDYYQHTCLHKYQSRHIWLKRGVSTLNDSQHLFFTWFYWNIWSKRRYLKKNIVYPAHSWPHMKKNLTIHKLSSLSLNASVYTLQTQVCTQHHCSSVSTLLSRNQSWHSCVNDAVPSSTSPTSPLLLSQYTNTIPHAAVWCGNSHFLSAWEIFGPNPCDAAWRRWGGFAPRPYPLL